MEKSNEHPLDAKLTPYRQAQTPPVTQNFMGIFAETINNQAATIHELNYKWWHAEDGSRLKRNIPEMLMLIVSEIAEGMEGYRKSLQDDKLPHRKMLEVELADAIIRIYDLAAGESLDIGGAIVEKLAFNTTREDHTYAARNGVNGKKF